MNTNMFTKRSRTNTGMFTTITTNITMMTPLRSRIHTGTSISRCGTSTRITLMCITGTGTVMASLKRSGCEASHSASLSSQRSAGWPDGGR